MVVKVKEGESRARGGGNFGGSEALASRRGIRGHTRHFGVEGTLNGEGTGVPGEQLTLPSGRGY